MARLRNLPPRVGKAPPRLAPAPDSSRQARRTLHTGSAEWRRLREVVLVRDAYICHACKRIAAGKGQAHVDHIDGDPSNNALTNLQTLCAPCHSAKTAREDRGFGNPRGGGV